MRRVCVIVCVLLASAFVGLAQQVQALRFEGLWKLNGPQALTAKLEFQVTGDTVTATYYHPHPSALSDIQIERDKFTGWYLDDFASRVTVTGQLEGSGLKLTLSRDGRDPVFYSGLRIPPDQSSPARHRVSGSWSTSGKGASGEFTGAGHSVVVSGGMEGNCISGSVGVDGKGASMNGCVSVSTHTP